MQDEVLAYSAASVDGSFLTKVFRRALLSSLVSIGGVLAASMVNSFVAGNLLGEETLAILSLTNPIYFFFATLGALSGVGASTIASQCVGRDDDQGGNAAVTWGLLISMGLSLVCALVGLVFLDPLLQFFGATDAFLIQCRPFAAAYLFSGVGVAGIYPPYFLLKLEGRYNQSSLLFAGLAVFVLGAELFFVGVLHMGVLGIGIGSAVGNLAAAMGGWIMLLHKSESFRLTSVKGEWKILGSMLVSGSPSGLNNLYIIVQTLLLNRLILDLSGSVGLSAFNVVIMAQTLTLIFINGMGQCTGPFVGVFAAEKDTLSLRKLEHNALRQGIIMMVLVTVGMLVWANGFCALFGIVTPQALAVAVPAVRIFAVSLVPSMISTVFLYYYLSAGFTGLANLLTVCRSLAVLVPCAYVLSPLLGVSSVWWAFLGAELGGWLALLVGYWFIRRKHPQLEGLFLLDRHFETAGHSFSFFVHAEEGEIVDTTHSTSSFCEENNLSMKKTMLITLALEEMLLSIQQHSFPRSPNETISVRIVVVPDQDGDAEPLITLRIRCGGAPFNPITYYQQQQDAQADSDEEEDELDALLAGLDDSFGIGMILAIAPVVNYQTTFGVNNLTILL